MVMIFFTSAVGTQHAFHIVNLPRLPLCQEPIIDITAIAGSQAIGGIG